MHDSDVESDDYDEEDSGIETSPVRPETSFDQQLSLHTSQTVSGGGTCGDLESSAHRESRLAASLDAAHQRALKVRAALGRPDTPPSDTERGLTSGAESETGGPKVSAHPTTVNELLSSRQRIPWSSFAASKGAGQEGDDEDGITPVVFTP